ncbi:ABC transporter ATP-binding protein [Tumebacillus permanentifrigoris]|uniref:Energy-coupling factor transport system ATP-binding protein n=1 Tax=Tumebacillus permanentifrigoris TaxID=378543 RepID=A0A316D957_9BACL|nr:ABC transporter ATP-binding protein [Tumebacillus permanentifrigoris]PWK13157.1 energy-coupling factor transport system ATP-binding protein [Tumebacillus permanentifrigoris]
MNTLTSKTPFLASEGVSVQFFDRDTPVLREMNVEIAKNEAVLLLGPSGSGKSTLLQVLSGIIPRSIEAWFKGTVIRPERVGVMFQDPDAQFCMLTVEDEIAFSLENRLVPRAQMRGIIEQVMRDVRLEVPLTTPIRELSGGLKQRLALACLLALEPEVLFVDEPTAQLDPLNTQLVIEDLRRLKGQKTLVMIEHKLDGVVEWVDRVLLFNATGQLVAQGNPREILRDHAQMIREYGIWQPKLWPVTWDEMLATVKHPLADRLEHQLAVQANSIGATLASDGKLLEQTQSDPHVSKAPILEVREASLRYKNGHVVWQGLNVSVQPGEWVAILGPNGAGKSTFLKLVGGLIEPTKGQVQVKGKTLSRYRTPELYDTVGFVFQNPEHQFIADTVFEEVAFGGKVAGWAQERIEQESVQLLTDFRLLDLRDKNPFTLSQGQKRRLSVAGMLLKRQEVLLLDEPTFGQDAATTAELLQRMQERNEAGTTILMATHDVELVAEYATRVLVIGEGKLLYDGRPHALFQQPDLLQRASLTAPLAYEYQLRRREQAAKDQGGHDSAKHEEPALVGRNSSEQKEGDLRV